MGWLVDLFKTGWLLILQAVPFWVVLFGGILAVRLLHWWMLGRHKDLQQEKKLPRQLALAFAACVLIIFGVLTLPISDSTKASVLSLFGFVLSAVIGISSTTFVSNAMAGIMLRSVRSFRAGDFVRVGEHFGRISEQGLFHTEIQTEDRDLTTFPNLLLVNNAVTVVRSSGTIVSTTLSLGYDIPRTRIEELLILAAKNAELEDPYVLVLALGDFSVTYKIAGLLQGVKQLISTRSRLRGEVLDVLHHAGIEIVSPSFMNQRQLASDSLIIPEKYQPKPRATTNSAPEEQIFDKAESAGREADLKRLKKKLEQQLEDLLASTNENMPQGSLAADDIESPPSKEHLQERILEIEQVLQELHAGKEEKSEETSQQELDEIIKPANSSK